MAFQKGFALGNDEGPDVFLRDASVEDALKAAQDLYPKHTPVLFEGDPISLEESSSSMEPNRAVSFDEWPELALKASGLPRVSIDEVMRLSIQDAHARLLPFFQYKYTSVQEKTRGQLVEVQAYDKPAKMASSFITQNAKLAKGLKGGKVPPGLSKGPQLLPHARAKDFDPKLPMQPKLGVCVGSSQACRDLCLVNTGQNVLADGPMLAKLAKTEALYADPVAWMRMYIESIRKHEAFCAGHGIDCYVRPNVLSDLPWELICPEVFGMFENVSFYDYTKVPGRVTPAKNYDLTFSMSGTKANERAMMWELDRGTRAAVVFWLKKPCKGKQRETNATDCDRASDLTFLGRKVIDGDDHDFRPLDPEGSIIGLTYKVPMTKDPVTGKRRKLMAPPKEARGFVLPARPDDMDPRVRFAVPVVYDTETGAIIVPGTPKSLGAGEIFEGDDLVQLRLGK